MGQSSSKCNRGKTSPSETNDKQAENNGAKDQEANDDNGCTGLSRIVTKMIEAIEQEEGLGAKVKRCIGTSELEYLDPFLLLDEYEVAHPAGFPDHPHRGHESVTYLLQGCLDYKDFLGSVAVIEPGDVQWLITARGMVHSEMPSSGEACHGLKLWVNLPKADKMVEPTQQTLKKEDIPFAEERGVHVRVIAGECMNVTSSVCSRTPTLYLDVELEKNASFNQPIPRGWNSFVYILSGKAKFGPKQKAKEGSQQHILIMSDGAQIQATNKEAEVCRFLLVAGKPLNEPMAREGAFVMNTHEEVGDAVKDHRFGRNGFEKAPDWTSGAGLDYLDSQF